MLRPSSIVTVLLVCAATVAHAQNPRDGAFVSSRRVRIAPARDGEVVVTEVLRVDTPSGRHGFARRIPRDTPLGQRLRIDVLAVTDGSLLQAGVAIPYTVAKSSGTITIDIGDASTFLAPGPDHQYRIDYRIHGAVESTRDADRLFVELGGLDLPTRPCGYFVVPPPGLEPQDIAWRLFRGGRGVTSGLQSQRYNDVVLIRDDESLPVPPLLDPHSSERVEIAWAPGTVAASPSGTPAAVADARVFLATLLVPLAALVLWARARRRRAGRLDTAAFLAGSDLPPAMATGALVAGRIGPRDHAAAALELILAGILDTGRDTTGRPTLARGTAPIGEGPLAAYERHLAAALCPDTNPVPLAAVRVRLARAEGELSRLANDGLDDAELLAHPLPPHSGALAVAIAQAAALLALVSVIGAEGNPPRAALALWVGLAGAAWACAAFRAHVGLHALAIAGLAAAGWLLEPHQLVCQDLPLALALGLGAAATSGAIALLQRYPAGEWCGRLGWPALGRIGEVAQALDANATPEGDRARVLALALALGREAPAPDGGSTGAHHAAADGFARALVDDGPMAWKAGNTDG